MRLIWSSGDGLYVTSAWLETLCRGWFLERAASHSAHSGHFTGCICSRRDVQVWFDVGHRLASMACSDSNVPLRRTAWRFIASAGNRCPSQDACIGICRLANVGGRKFLSRQMVLMQSIRAGLLAEDDSGAWFCISE